jgi:hypothetical protein
MIRLVGWCVSMRLVIILLCCAVLSACFRHRAELSQDAQSYMAGMSKEEVLRCMGTPTQKATEGPTEVWSFDSGNGGLGMRGCSVSVALVGDHVSQVNYSGGLLSRGGQCAFAVQSCMQGLTDAPRS